MGTAMDALKYSGYMSAQAGLSSLYSSPASSESLSKMYGGEASSGQDTKPEYPDSLSRSYLEQQKAYYESAGLKGYGGYGGAETKPSAGEPPAMSGRQSVESPDLKKQEEAAEGQAMAGQAMANQAMASQAMAAGQAMATSQAMASAGALQSQQAALQAYYSQSMGLAQGQAGGQGGQAGGVLPPLLPMAAQLSQYAGAGAGAPYPAQSASPGTDYGRRPLSVLF